MSETVPFLHSQFRSVNTLNRLEEGSGAGLGGDIHQLLRARVPLLRVHLIVVGVLSSPGLSRRPANVIIFIAFALIFLVAVPGVVFFRWDDQTSKEWNKDDYAMIALFALQAIAWPILWFKMSQRAFLTHIADVLRSASTENVIRKAARRWSIFISGVCILVLIALFPFALLLSRASLQNPAQFGNWMRWFGNVSMGVGALSSTIMISSFWHLSAVTFSLQKDRVVHFFEDTQKQTPEYALQPEYRRRYLSLRNSIVSRGTICQLFFSPPFRNRGKPQRSFSIR